MNTACLTSLDKYDSSAEAFQILCALSFFVISFFISFILWGEGGDASHKTRMYNDKIKKIVYHNLGSDSKIDDAFLLMQVAHFHL